jgi:hypothetical protein
MAASRQDVDRWIQVARENGHEFILSVCDTFDYDDYPVYCENREELMRRYDVYNGKNMQRVNEIIRVPKKKDAIENLSIYDF